VQKEESEVLAFGIRYLTGFVAAAEPGDLERAEWPPHPARIFMALAAAHFQTGADPSERAALLWLEGATRDGEISAPVIAAPDAIQRAVVKHYVPVNDKAGPSKALLHSLPLTRDRQDRVFARAWLDDDCVYLQWPDLDPPEPHRKALADLCAKVTRIGHSSSLVQVWLIETDEVTAPNWVPDEERATTRMRIAGPGALDHLEQQYNAAAVEGYADLKVTEIQDDPRAQKAARKRLREQYGNRPPPRQRPRLSLYQGYARPLGETATREATGTVFSPHVLAFQLGARQGPFRHLDLIATLTLVSRWREAILSHANGLPEPVRRMLSGHGADGGPAEEPHLAFLPLAFVGDEHADGHLLGMGLALPAHLSRDERREALRAIAAVRELKLGPLGVWQVDAVAAEQPARALRPEAWTAHPKGATHWSTVTPIALDRHPKASDKAQYQKEVAVSIAAACDRVGLPKPREVVVTQVSAHPGVPPSFAFSRLQRKNGSERRHTHAILVFDELVCGPMLIGAGRFRGYGVCRPMTVVS
jgi:CRISPR-associated protein Csb2